MGGCVRARVRVRAERGLFGVHKMAERERERTEVQGGDSKGHNFIAPNGALIIAQKVNNLSMNFP